MEIINENYTQENFWQQICVPFLEDHPSMDEREVPKGIGRASFAYDLM
jgi:hypothetical protein